MFRWPQNNWKLTARRMMTAPSVALTVLLTFWMTPANAGSISEAQCKADQAEFLASISAIREASLAQVNEQIKETTHPQTKAGLAAMREGLWDEEEQQRGQAQQILRDCLKAASGNR